MSRSFYTIALNFHMLDGCLQCVPEMKDTSAGHVMFKSGAVKLNVHGPGSWTFDELDEPYDRDKWVARVKEEILRDLTLGRRLDVLLATVFDQAKMHCDACHQDLREAEANGKRIRKCH